MITVETLRANRHRGAARAVVLIAAVAFGACKRGGGDASASAASGGGAAGRGGRAGGGGGRRAMKFPVEVEAVASRAVEYTVNAVGSVEAFEIVQVTARVQGVVEKVRFTEGERVKPATVLAEIEPQRYRLAVDSARAALEKTRAAQADAAAGLERREKAVATTPGLIPGEEINTWRTRLRTAEADVNEKQAALAQAELNLRDAYVRAPVGGVIETRKVETGQYVQPGTVLTTLVRREPLLLRFSVAAPEAGPLRPGMTTRFQTREDRKIFQARITHVAQAADPGSRMVAVTAEVTGGEGREQLRPGAFAEVTIPVGAKREAPALPQTAVRPTERGFTAYIVKDGVAHERILTLGMRSSDGRVEVRSGVDIGELVVVRGAEALREGVAVEVEKAARADAGGRERLLP